MAEVTLNGVRKLYPNGFEAVKGFDLAIRDGEFVVLVGPSGCGKSTTLRMVAGLEDVSGGEIKIGGRVVNDVHPKDRDIAMVFQNYALYPHMSVYKNMAFALQLRKVPKPEIDRRVRDAAKILGLEALLDRKPKQLSGGQRQRVAVGRAIVREPKAFLFDEPLSNLNAKLRVTTRAELKVLHLRLKTTTIYVTHDQEEAMTLGDRIVVMSNGLIQQADTPMEVYRHPNNRFVAAFVGTPPMNFLEGTLERTASGLVFVEGSSDADGKAYRLAVPASRDAALAAYVGKPIVLGLRPQMIHAASAGANAGNDPSRQMKMTVRVTEPLGDSIDAFLGTPKHTHIVARVPGTAHLTIGQPAVFTIDMDAAHFFEPGEFGKNLIAKQ
ncbi:MAG: sn-glycerol-3-phosphate ABC transporter ATP-binding protein UgpC [Planctomycetota bacterium]|nr:sn-glycerol-3-phosphate ABC transporter ATP-binding protein UgpC [Planctomycetota bacterium]